MSFTSGQVLTAAQLNNLDIDSLTVSGATSAQITFTTDGDNYKIVAEGDAQDWFYIYNITDSAYRFLIDGSGKVVLGGDTARTPLTVLRANKLGSSFTGTTEGEGLRVDQTNYSANNFVGLVEAAYQSDQSASHVRIAAQFTSGGSKLGFGTTNNYSAGVNNQAMTIDVDGDVGVGDASPEARLHVNSGAVNLGVLVESTDAGAILGLKDNSTSGNSYVGIRADGDDLKLRAGNSNQVEISSGGQARFQDGSAATPAIAFTGDTDTGFYRYGSGTIGWSGNNNFGGYLWNNGIRCDAGSASLPAFAFSADTDTGMYNVTTNQLGMVTGGSLRARFYSSGLLMGNASTGNAQIGTGSGSASAPTYHFYGDTNTGMYRNTTDQLSLTTGGTVGLIAAGGTVNTAGLATSSTSGYQYVLRNNSFGTLYRFTSSADVKENIENVTDADAGSWMDALQPVTFINRWLQEGEEPDDDRAFREADVQVGFIADDVLANSTTARFAQVEDVDGTLKGVGWKWECVIAAAVAEIKSLRARIATLEAA